MHIYTYIYIHTRVRLCMCAGIHTYINTYVRTYIHRYMYMYKYIKVLYRMRRKTHAFSAHPVCLGAHRRTHARTHACTHCRSIHLHALNNLATRTFIPSFFRYLHPLPLFLLSSHLLSGEFPNIYILDWLPSKIYSSVTLLNIAGDQSSSRSLNYRTKGPRGLLYKGQRTEKTTRTTPGDRTIERVR